MTGHDGKGPGDRGVHEPVSETAEALTFCPDTRREDLANEHPNDRALGKREERDEPHQQPDQPVLMTGAEKHRGHAR